LKEQDIKMIVFSTLKQVGKMSGDEYLEPVINRLGFHHKELEQIYIDIGHVLPFLVWANKQMGLEEKNIFDLFFNGRLDPKMISSEDIMKALRTLREELPFIKERRIAESIIRKIPFAQLVNRRKSVESQQKSLKLVFG